MNRTGWKPVPAVWTFAGPCHTPRAPGARSPRLRKPSRLTPAPRPANPAGPVPYASPGSTVSGAHEALVIATTARSKQQIDRSAARFSGLSFTQPWASALGGGGARDAGTSKPQAAAVVLQQRARAHRQLRGNRAPARH